MQLVLVVLSLVCSASNTGYSDCNLDCMVVHGGGSCAGGGGGGGSCTGGCCPCSTGTYTGTTLYCVVVMTVPVVVVAFQQ